MALWDLVGLGNPFKQLDRIERNQERLMGQVDDLKAVVQQIQDQVAVLGPAVGTIDTKLDGVRSSIDAVAAEVADILNRLGGNNPDVQDAIIRLGQVRDSLAGIGTQVDAVSAEVDTAQGALSAIPPAP